MNEEIEYPNKGGVMKAASSVPFFAFVSLFFVCLIASIGAERVTEIKERLNEYTE